METAREKAAWDHTANLLAAMHQIHCRGRFSVAQFHPYYRAPRGAPITASSIETLIAAWVPQ